MLTADKARKAIQEIKDSTAHGVEKIMFPVEQGIKNAIIKLQTSFDVPLATEPEDDVKEGVLKQLKDLGYEARFKYESLVPGHEYERMNHRLYVSFDKPIVQENSTGFQQPQEITGLLPSHQPVF